MQSKPTLKNALDGFKSLAYTMSYMKLAQVRNVRYIQCTAPMNTRGYAPTVTVGMNLLCGKFPAFLRDPLT